MKFFFAALLIVVLLASLGFQGVRSFKRAAESARPLVWMFEPDELRPGFARQQYRLCEFARASQPDTTTMKLADEKFRQIQHRYGQLKIEDPLAVAIVTVPQISLREHQTYAWRIYVPPDQTVELAAYVTNHVNSTTSTVFVPNSFTQVLSTGESVIQVEWRDRYFGKWGGLPSAASPKQSGMTVSINENAFRWQSECGGVSMSISTADYPTQQSLFDSDDTAKLSWAARPGGARDELHLVVRQVKTQ